MNPVQPVQGVQQVQGIGVNPAPTGQKPGFPGQAKEKPKGLHAKMLAVMNEVQYLQKDGQINFGNNHYRFLSETKITQSLRQSFLNHGLLVFPMEVQPEKIGNVTQIAVKYKIVDTESGESEVLGSLGQGADGQDKGGPKAMTGAYKYMLRQTFMIPTGDDPDNISTEELNEDPNLKAINQGQISQITAMMTTLGWNQQVMRNFSQQTLGSSDLTQYTEAMATRLIGAMQQAQQQPAQPQGIPQQ